ncbi:hypothetical protein M3M33_14115, partial [Loigolactobacillus coryniformis]|uniref:hypothetical protein n=1 Tax=Loigolactobacillus coryniformis TaxID=1610 RepID=UPI00201B03FF
DMAGTTKFFTQNLFTKWVKLGFDYSGLIYSDFKRGDHLYYSFQKNPIQPIPILLPENGAVTENVSQESTSKIPEKQELFDNEGVDDNMPDF